MPVFCMSGTTSSSGPLQAALSLIARLFYFFGFIFLLALGRKIPALQRRTCSFHSPEKFLTLSLGLGSLVKDAISTELLSLDRSKIEGMFKEIQSIRSKVPSKE